jgi:hypothetical protein
MKADMITRLEKLLERKYSDAEKARLRTIGRVFNIGDNDILWSIVAALEYQRSFYDELPQKIATASSDILQGISEAAETEAKRAQHRLAESVAELAKRLALRINMSTLLPMGLFAMICQLAYGSLAMWAGFHIRSGQTYDVLWILRMPSGVLMGFLALGGALFLGVYAARDFGEENNAWKKKTLVILTMLFIGGSLLALSL